MAPNKLSSVLARFEETIDQNNAAGVCSGMYLTNQAGRTSPSRTSPVRKSSSHQRNSGGATRRSSATGGGSLNQLKPGVYRNMLKTTDVTVNTASTVECEENDWDPFHCNNVESGNESLSSFGDASFASFSEDESAANSITPTRKERPKEKKSSGRRNPRISKTKKLRKDPNKSERRSSTKASLPSREEEEDEQSDDDGGFALTYISARDKFTALAKQNSDRQLSKQSSRRKLLSGLKMTSKENVLSTSSNHSSSSSRQSLTRSGSSRSVEGAPRRSSTTRRASSNKLLDCSDDCASPTETKSKKPKDRSKSSLEMDSTHSRSSKLDSTHSKSSRSRTKSGDKSNEEVGRPSRTTSLRVPRSFQHTKNDI